MAEVPERGITEKKSAIKHFSFCNLFTYPLTSAPNATQHKTFVGH